MIGSEELRSFVEETLDEVMWWFRYIFTVTPIFVCYYVLFRTLDTRVLFSCVIGHVIVSAAVVVWLAAKTIFSMIEEVIRWKKGK